MNQVRAYGRTPTPVPRDVNWFGLLQVGCVLLVGYSLWQIHRVYVNRQNEWDLVQNWLKSHGLKDHANIIHSAGIKSMADINDITLPLDKESRFKLLPPDAIIKFERAIQTHHDELLLKLWLDDHDLTSYYDRLLLEDIHSLDALAHISDMKLRRVLGHMSSQSTQEKFQKKLQKLHALAPNYNQYQSDGMMILSGKTIVGGLLCIALFISLFFYKMINSACTFIQAQQRHKHLFLDFLMGQYLAPGRTIIDWKWEDQHIVGHTFHFFVRWNGKPFALSQPDDVLVEISQGTLLVTPIVQLVKSAEEQTNSIKVTFTIHRAGVYKITVMVAGKHISGSPFKKTFVPGPIDPLKSTFVNQGSVVVGCRGKILTLTLEPRDCYGNLCDYTTNNQLLDKFQIIMTETDNNTMFRPVLNCQYLKHVKQLSLNLDINKLGCYHTVVTYNGQKLKNSEFHILILSENDLALVEKVIAKKSHNTSFDARLLSTSYHSPTDKGKKIQCYISPKQLTIKELQFKIIPKKLFAFRVCPSTKFQFLGMHNQLEMPILSIEDGCHSPVLLASKDRNLIAATFSKHLMKNIGGSETFKDKQDFFYHEIRQLHSKRIHYKLTLRINREKLLESSVKATKHFSTSDWCKNFEIVFHQEEGLDWGGVKREWFELLCVEMFDPTKSGMFMRFKDDPQALAHPNHQHSANLKLKCYEFAGKIVGKCLYESALGGGYKLQVKAKFTRSFLAQLIGLRINYKYFEKDDPDLYTSKICYIEDHDVDDMELYFIDEEFYEGKLVKVHELIPDGAKIPVTNANKKKYLDLLAQYRLYTRVRDEIEAFLKGLNELIPDNLLSIFDENELELLLCGTGDYSIEDFKKNHVVSGSSPEFSKLLDWFWQIVSGYTQEQMAQLLQFTTGCSQLPPGGFSQLSPKFQILAAPTYNVLPTAHTCFNQLCLPDYDSLEDMRKALHMAITEGNQGFQLV